jgi:hypothetical protein
MTSFPDPTPPGKAVNLPPDAKQAGQANVTVNLSYRQLQDLHDQATFDGITLTEAIRRSIEVGQLAWDASRRGGRLLVDDGHGSLREIDIRGSRAK